MTGLAQEEKKPIRLKKHGRPAKSIFRKGLEFLDMIRRFRGRRMHDSRRKRRPHAGKDLFTTIKIRRREMKKFFQVLSSVASVGVAIITLFEILDED